jgi:hypothetical protein
LKRALTPSTNAPGLGSAAAAIYAAVVMIWNATHHHAVIDPQVIVAALGAAAFLYARFKVTPVADPKDGNGQPLVAAPPVAPLYWADRVDPEALRPPPVPPEKTLIQPPAAPE